MFGISSLVLDYSTITTIILPFFIIGILVIYVYLKLSYGYWFYAPVFHLYDFHYYFYPKGIVEQNMPQKNKFTNLIDIKMYTFDKIQNTYLFKQFVSFIHSHYMRNNFNNYMPSIQDTEPYFTNHKHACFISYYYKTQLLHQHTHNSVTPRKQIIGIMTTRPVQIQIKKSASSFLKMYGYYVDYLCVHRDHRKKGIAPQQIQTHYYHQRHSNPAIHVNIFKREGELTGIVPLCVYDTYMFDLQYIVSSTTSSLPIIYKRVRCSSGNMRYFMDFMKRMGETFDITICPDLANLLDLIKSDNYIVDYIVDTTKDNEIVSCYIYKETSVTTDKSKNVIACVASVRSAIFDPDMFYYGFIWSLENFLTTHQRILIENISHNPKLSDKLKETCQPIGTSPTAYFFHNYIYPTFTPSKVLIIGT